VYAALVVTVSAQSAKAEPFAANYRHGEPTTGTRVLAGTYPMAATDLVTGWHTHDLHQIEYACQGIVEVETAAARYLLPPQQAVWIPAGLNHCTSIRDVRTVSVFFEPEGFRAPLAEPSRAQVITVAPVLREMILHAERWSILRETSDRAADEYFTALGQIVAEALEAEAPLFLPASSDPLTAAVMKYTDAHLRDVTVLAACRAVGISERTLRRHFTAVTGMTWRDYLLRSRLLRAMTALTEQDATVLEISHQVGFDSVSAFARAFRRLTGQSPTQYRREVRTVRAD
jgi:AraC-like DNA-binding protein/quercetin dioxygenase-like cupin family protein